MASEQLKTIVDMLRARPAPETFDPVEVRKGMEAFSPPPEADITLEVVDAGGVPAEWTSAPDASADRAILYLHGGGYVIGSVKTHRDLCGRLSRAARARVLSVDYRLGPEHPFPAAVDDAVTAYRYLLDQGVAPARIVVAGDSAGGGLTAATLLALRDAGHPLPAGGVMISPWVDLEGKGESMTTRADRDPMVQKDGLLQMAAAYLGGADPTSPLAAPLHGDLAGLPPLLIQVGTSETLYDDSTRFEAKARAAGVDVELESWEEMIHVWHAFAGMLPEGQQAIERIGEWILKRVP